MDGENASSFQGQLSENIKNVRRDIQLSRFTFGRLRGAPVVKASGGMRLIAIPNVRARLVQRCLLAHLESDKKFPQMSSIAYGFTKARTLKCAQLKMLELRNSYPWVLQVDIIKFFDEIQRSDVKKLVRRHVRSKIVSELLCSAVDCEIDDRIDRIRIYAQDSGVRRGAGLRQGMPVSPLLSNLLLREFDAALVKRGLQAVRYADDIAIFANSKQECRDNLDFVKAELGKLKLRISDIEDLKKTIISGPETTVYILGVDIKKVGHTYELRAPNKKIENIKAHMKSASSLDECIKKRYSLAKVSSILDSFVVGHFAALSVVADREQFLNRISAEKENCIKGLLVELFGQSVVDNLDNNKRAVLGLGEFTT